MAKRRLKTGNQHTLEIEIISINRHNYTKTHLLNPTVSVNLDNNGVFLAKQVQT